MIEAKSLDRARNAIRSLLQLTPEMATVQQADGDWVERPAKDVTIGQTVRVKPGERVALDVLQEPGELIGPSWRVGAVGGPQAVDPRIPLREVVVALGRQDEPALAVDDLAPADLREPDRARARRRRVRGLEVDRREVESAEVGHAPSLNPTSDIG